MWNRIHVLRPSVEFYFIDQLVGNDHINRLIPVIGIEPIAILFGTQLNILFQKYFIKSENFYIFLYSKTSSIALIVIIVDQIDGGLIPENDLTIFWQNLILIKKTLNCSKFEKLNQLTICLALICRSK